MKMTPLFVAVLVPVVGLDLLLLPCLASPENAAEPKSPRVVRVDGGTEVEIQAAIDRLLASGGGTVELKPALYWINRPLRVGAPGNITITSSAKSPIGQFSEKLAPELRANADMPSMITVKNDDGDGLIACVNLIGLVFDGNGKNLFERRDQLPKFP